MQPKNRIGLNTINWDKDLNKIAQQLVAEGIIVFSHQFLNVNKNNPRASLNFWRIIDRIIRALNNDVKVANKRINLRILPEEIFIRFNPESEIPYISDYRLRRK